MPDDENDETSETAKRVAQRYLRGENARVKEIREDPDMFGPDEEPDPDTGKRPEIPADRMINRIEKR